MPKTAKIDCAGAGQNTIVAAVDGKRIRVLGYTIVAAGSVTAKWQSASTDLSGAMSMIVGTPISPPPSAGQFGYKSAIIETENGEALNLNLGGAVQVSGHLEYELVA